MSPFEAESGCCYHLEFTKLQSDGTVMVYVGGWNGSIRWSGCREILPDDPDYPFWKWIIEKEFRASVNDEGLQELRTRFEKQVTRRAN